MTTEEAKGKALMAVGCDSCSKAGYRGRKGIYEMMPMTAQIREMAFRQDPVNKIRQAAIANGMRTLVDDGRVKVLKGITTAGEIARSTQIEGLG